MSPTYDFLTECDRVNRVIGPRIRSGAGFQVLACAKPPDQDVQPVPELLLAKQLDCPGDGRIIERQHAAEQEHIRMARFDGMDEPLRADIDAQIDHVDVLDSQEADHDVLADVMDVPLHNADHDPADRRHARLFRARRDQGEHLLIDHAGHDQIRDEILALVKQLVDLRVPRVEAIQHPFTGNSRVQHGLCILQRLFVVQTCYGVN